MLPVYLRFVSLDINRFYFPRYEISDCQISEKHPEWCFFNATGAFIGNGATGRTTNFEEQYQRYRVTQPRTDDSFDDSFVLCKPVSP